MLQSTVSLVVLLGLVSAALAQEEGLVAYYKFDEGQGTVVRDHSGNGLDGTVHGAKFLRNASGYCLEFDGQTSYVDCGAPPALDLRQTITVEAWIMPSGRPKGEPGILGKQFSSFLLTYYHDGQVYWYIGQGGNNSNAPVPDGSWHLVTGTFDGENINLYLDGRLFRSVVSRFKEIPSGGKFLIGCVSGSEGADDPNYRRTAHFSGLIDEVRVYNRALSAEEIAAHATTAAPDLEVREPFTPVQAAARLSARQVSVSMAKDGRLQVESGGARFSVDSAFGYPGDQLGWNSLGTGAGEPDWSPRLTSEDAQVLEVSARGASYTLQRRVRIVDEVVTVEDRLTSLTTQPVGLLARHYLTSDQKLTASTSPGGAENPTIFLRTGQGGIGVVMEDNLSRLHFDSVVGLRANQALFRWGNMALDRGKTIVLKWAMLPLPPEDDYFGFMNRLRQRWNSNFTVEGPFNWISMTDPKLDDPAALKAWLDFKQCKLMALGEWLDYDPGPQSRVWTRQEYKEKAVRARDILKSVQPDIKVLGCIETDWVTIYPERIPGGDKLPVAGTGASGGLSVEQTRIIEEAGLPWLDSAKRGPDGTMTLELYMRGGKPQTALAVYPAFDPATGKGNYQYEFLMGQVRFLLDEVGLDGYYIDEFSQGWSGGIPTYGQWDGISAEVDPRNGKIIRFYTDCSLAGVHARVNLVQAAVSRGKVVVANTYATAMEEQALPVNRFSETQGAFNPMTWDDGQKPAALPSMLRSSLASPIGLGIIGQPQLKDTARRIMKAVVTYLRHGMLYYHYAIEDIPREGPGSGEYGPINHMFPITIVGLHEGWIEGKERIITCVSGTYWWNDPNPPQVRVFDLDGRLVYLDPQVDRIGERYQVHLSLDDWAQIAVIER
ncbi:MAG: LamG domain-containing protein [Armatimonadetes bacterium]|nr:LamG domain-containing protein [Armatimonadota bacterium]